MSISREIGMFTSGAVVEMKLHAIAKVEFKLHNFASDSHHCFEVSLKSIL